MYKVLLFLGLVFLPVTQALAQQLAKFDSVKTLAEALIKSGFRAGDGYGEVWIRDLNTFMEVSCKVNDKSVIKKHLLTFFQFQQPDGGILDGYVPKPTGTGGGYNYYYTPLAPEYAGHKNTVETDQETSLVQAVTKYVRCTGDSLFLQELVDGVPVIERMNRALKFLVTNRLDSNSKLIWGATTVDWGDVQPEHNWGVELNKDSHRAIDVYDNAMFIIAINDYVSLVNSVTWVYFKNRLAQNIRKYLWDKKRKQFKPHIYLNGSPFPASFNEADVYYHGGTAVAIEAGLLSKKEVLNAYHRMQDNVKKANASSIGLTIYPTYPAGTFLNKGMGPYAYQNGGDWTWFGARMVTQLARYGYKKEAQEAIQPMLDRVLKNKGFYEWYTPDNQPKGSSSFRGEAGVLWTAIQRIQAMPDTP